jgi:hypothetical protein
MTARAMRTARNEDTPLHGLEAVFQIRDGPVLDHIGSVFEKILVNQVFA